MTLPMQITGVEIRQTPNGLYCLNDLHQAAGGEDKSKPGNWLRNEQAKALIDEISNCSDLSSLPIETMEGRNGGTYVCELLVYNYAAWISPKFNLLVFETFMRVVHGEQVSKPSLGVDFEQALASVRLLCEEAGITRKNNLHGYYQLAKDFGLERYFQPHLEDVQPKKEVVKAIGEQQHGAPWFVTLELFLKALTNGKVNQNVYPWLIEEGQFYVRTSTIVNYLRSVPELYKYMLQFGINSDRVLKKELKKQNLINIDGIEKSITQERHANMVAMSVSLLKSQGFSFPASS
ncbi:KilA-N domain-containing protein [Vibrio cholerae]|nr:KilA-N domain-containing protein [Vibrio cholerae]EKA4530341.1 KilA-N domain-containing protein [Vibrio cholerae]EKF9203496.1 KilA-N domain-containing protein [Vibrio cholerae]HDL9433467.1 KilA-N domain-containing protein [Vibrio cholerae]